MAHGTPRRAQLGQQPPHPRPPHHLAPHVGQHLGQQPVHDLRQRQLDPAVLAQVGSRHQQRIADQRVGVRVAPAAAERLDQPVLRGDPGRLGVDQGAVQVPQHGLQAGGTGRVGRPASGPAHLAAKYLASGCGTMIAEVDCSGTSWNSSDSATPIRSGPQQPEQLLLVLQVRAGRVAEGVPRAPVALLEDLVQVGRVLRRVLPAPRAPGGATARPAPRSAAPTGRAPRGSRGSCWPRTARWRTPRSASPW